MMQRLFFEAHEEEMLEGTEVLWEDKLSYYDLIEMKVTEGEASFNSELQNDPIDPDNATFNEEWFDWYEPELMDWKSSEYIFIGSNDLTGKEQEIRYQCHYQSCIVNQDWIHVCCGCFN